MKGFCFMNKIIGNWKTEHDDETSAGELIIDDDCVEFSTMNTAEVFPTCFIGGNWDFKCKVYTHGMGETTKTNLDCGYRVQKAVRYNGDFSKYPGAHIDGIEEFSFEIIKKLDKQYGNVILKNTKNVFGTDDTTAYLDLHHYIFHKENHYIDNNIQSLCAEYRIIPRRPDAS